MASTVTTKRKKALALPKQPEVNIGTIGHVDHGKTTLVEAITGVWAAKHSEELRRGITIKLGYADAPIFKCPNCDEPQCYTSSTTCPSCGSKAEFVRAISFVDAPGHEALMATMLSGATVMDGALLIIAANEKCPQPQTREHLAAIELAGVTNIIIIQNKIDIVDQKRALASYKEIQEFVKGTIAEGKPIIPVSAQHMANVDAVLQAIEKFIPTPERDPNKPPRMFVVRSFDVNKPGDTIDDLDGGVIGGSIFQGSFKVGDEVEIRPGIRVDKQGKTFYEPIFTEITSLSAGGKQVDEAKSGGLVGIGTYLDPSMTKADGLTGNMVGKPDLLPPTRSEIVLETKLLKRAIGTKELVEVSNIIKGEKLLLDVGTTITIGAVTSSKKDSANLTLVRPICAEDGARVAISRKIGGRWRLIGYGIIQSS
ncbi:MAG: translation initiation factor IF-2 subunit gamma [Candidatus Bathyarchaeota archaeon]|nr:translation initiation factor IF-2 subunit gamma [Candidatus Bathyarchaeum tardum]WGM88776.1 MAG: translation initiation factor IF-2 subunit gamma [Candidatus Bathyarchaeum tardum]WNZ28971.1 MAG: translation initiation factor IF-2 subunit gamma [Candidatus Bathyarchaeota archaeon]